ncbi:unnamed protein product [Prunus armeniaca]|uniref:Uncharacterized protein n=1 Tax=Prunus armeniaca TaxID=36596 RepID=A0A6J5X576_PRUAR|nr:unnamed protein product [Prunus armeniaca]
MPRPMVVTFHPDNLRSSYPAGPLCPHAFALYGAVCFILFSYCLSLRSPPQPPARPHGRSPPLCVLSSYLLGPIPPLRSLRFGLYASLDLLSFVLYALPICIWFVRASPAPFAWSVASRFTIVHFGHGFRRGLPLPLCPSPRPPRCPLPPPAGLDGRSPWLEVVHFTVFFKQMK